MPLPIHVLISLCRDLDVKIVPNDIEEAEADWLHVMEVNGDFFAKWLGKRNR
jgi:hypothetical protein